MTERKYKIRNEMRSYFEKNSNHTEQSYLTPDTWQILMEAAELQVAQELEQQRKNDIEKIKSLIIDEYPTEDGKPVETYGYEKEYNNGVIDAIAIISEQKP